MKTPTISKAIIAIEIIIRVCWISEYTGFIAFLVVGDPTGVAICT